MVVKNVFANAGDMDLIPGLGSLHMPQGNQVGTPQPWKPCSKTHTPQLKGSFHSPQLEEACTQQWRPSIAKKSQSNHTIFLLKFLTLVKARAMHLPRPVRPYKHSPLSTTLNSLYLCSCWFISSHNAYIFASWYSKPLSYVPHKPLSYIKNKIISSYCQLRLSFSIQVILSSFPP